VSARLVEDAQRIAAVSNLKVVGIAVWDGHSRGAHDVTAAFVDLLREEQIPVRHVPTLVDTLNT
jgi:hypothetical protein